MVDTDFYELVQNEWQPNEKTIHEMQNLQENIILNSINDVTKIRSIP